MKVSKLFSMLVTLVLITSLFVGCSGNNVPNSSITEPAPSTSTEPAPSTSDENDGYEEGTSETDDIVNTTSAEKVILVVSFGTSYNQTRHLNIGAIETAIQNAYPDYQVRRAFTSQIIIDKLAKREKLTIDSVREAMDRLVLDKVKEVVVLPTTVMNGFEFHDVIAEVGQYTDKFESLKIGTQLLASDDDYDKVAEVLVAETSHFRSEDTAIVLMGHGTEHEAGVTYTKFQETLNAKGYTDYLVGTVEHGIELDDIREMLSSMNAKKVVLRPLMIVAGDHANNDMAGDEEDSWKVILEQDGYDVEVVLEGLGQIEGIQDLFISHVKDTIDSESVSTTPAAAAVGIAANRIESGTYSIEVESDASMFRIVDCQLTVNESGMNAVMTLSGQGYGALYMGSTEEAVADKDNQHIFTLVDEKHSFTIPVEALDRGISCAALGLKSGNWFDHTIVFRSDNIPADAFMSAQIDAELTGGSGKASVESPATLLYKDGQNFAQIVWSSPNYIYMLVDGIEYLPINVDGNSSFEIPVKLDTDMTVVACTVAMGSPKEIEYNLYFDSSSVK
ncbi:MAG: hypothetical protein GX763_04375 [Clostridiaceae bacterium]|nr:hypothetical protein [Clostridiaceae bacterium]